MAKGKWFSWGKKDKTPEKKNGINQDASKEDENKGQGYSNNNDVNNEELSNLSRNLSQADSGHKENHKEKAGKTSFFERLKGGLKKTRDSITTRIDQVLVSFGKIDDDLFDELEEILITSDIGMETSMKIISELREKVRQDKITSTNGIRQAIKDIIFRILSDGKTELNLNTKPTVIVVIGVNGVGKTTSIGKLANLLIEEGKKVTIAAADTFRAAAIDQLEIWADKAGAGLIKHKEGADPSAVIYDAIQHCKSKGVDVLICDTAGRLHTKKNLMEELKKTFRVIKR